MISPIKKKTKARSKNSDLQQNLERIKQRWEERRKKILFERSKNFIL